MEASIQEWKKSSDPATGYGGNGRNCLVNGRMRFAERLQQFREERRLSQAELGEAIGSSGPTIHRWEKGVGGPSLKQAVDLAKLLCVRIEQLAYEEPPDTAAALSADERAILDLFRALRLEKDEALRRLAGHESEYWLPGSVRDLTPPTQTPRGRPRQRGETERPAEWAPGQRLEDEPKKGGRKPAG